VQCQYLQKRNAEQEEQFVLKNVVLCFRTVHLLFVVGLCVSKTARILTKKGKTELQSFSVSLFVYWSLIRDTHTRVMSVHLEVLDVFFKSI